MIEEISYVFIVCFHLYLHFFRTNMSWKIWKHVLELSWNFILLQPCNGEVMKGLPSQYLSIDQIFHKKIAYVGHVFKIELLLVQCRYVWLTDMFPAVLGLPNLALCRGSSINNAKVAVVIVCVWGGGGGGRANKLWFF